MIISVALSLALQSAPALPASRPLGPLVVDVKGVKKPAPTKPASAAVLEVGKKVFGARCAGCHGATGNSDGPIGKALKPTPQRFTDALWAARITDEELLTAIRDGGAAVKRSAAMPAHKDLSAEQLTGVVAFVRTLRSPHGTASVTVMFADGKDVTAAADADAAGNAKVTVPGVSGKATVIGVVDESGNPLCAVEIADVAGAVVRCAR